MQLVECNEDAISPESIQDAVEIDYIESESAKSIFNSYEVLFKDTQYGILGNDKQACLHSITSCAIYEDCGDQELNYEAYGIGVDGRHSKFGIRAKQNVLHGYSYSACVKCSN